MRFSDLSTDKALDVMCELTPSIYNIVSDPETVSTIGKVVVPKDEKLSRYGVFVLLAGRLTEFVPLLLKNHRSDVYNILSVLNEKPVAEIAAQPAMDTMRQIREVFEDKSLMDFFKSSAQREKTEQSAPSASSPG